MRKICVYTATRAEYGLLRPLLQPLQQAEDVELQLLVSGAHLSPEFGLTYRQILADGFTIDEQVEMLTSSDTPNGICQSMGLAMIGYGKALERLKPDLLVVLGDRYETLCLASVAQIHRIPIAHLHGGEASEGVMDEAFRHSITKMSHLHFTACEDYRRRVIQLGEDPSRVWNVGAIGIENVRQVPRLSREELAASLGLALDVPFFVVTFHPTPEEGLTVSQQAEILLEAMDAFPDHQVIFTEANADTNGRVINEYVRTYAAEHSSRCICVASLGTQRYFSAVALADAVIGNSSSGILEVPALGTPTVNIGSRQAGRIQPSSIVNCNIQADSIIEAIRKTKMLLLDAIQNPYEQENTAKAIVSHLRTEPLSGLLKKRFYDLPAMV